MTVLVTGASGFIGCHVVAALLRRSLEVRIVRRLCGIETLPVSGVEITSLSGSGGAVSDWSEATAGCSAVIHLAARAHLLRQEDGNSAQQIHFANVDFARACAEAAARNGVQRFIFLSSVGVHGRSREAQLIHVDSAIAPGTPYARSKADAELALADVVRDTDMKLTVLRPPLVYGPAAPGNFGALANAIARGWPMPLSWVTKNRRSFVAIDNLVDLIMTCLQHPAATNQTFLVSDGEDLSTADLMYRMGLAMGRPARLFPVPAGILAWGFRLLGKPEMFESLCGSLQVDISKTQRLLGWEPPIGVDEGLKKAVGGLLC